MKSRNWIPAVFLFSSIAFGQTPTAVTDAASFVNRVAPGALATVFGTGLSVDTLYAQPPLPLPTDLGGVQVTVNGVAAPLIYVSPMQINFQVPGATAIGTADLVVIVGDNGSDALSFTVEPASPGIFAYNAAGRASDPTLLQVVAQNPPDYNNNDINSPSNPAPAGSTIVVYVGGVGEVQSPVGDGYPATSADPALSPSFAMIGSEPAPISYLGLSPGSVGLGQANIQIPSDLPSGNYPLLINIGGLQSISATLSVSGSGTLPAYLDEVNFRGGFEVSNRTTLQVLDTTLYLCGDVRVRVFDITKPGLPVFDGHYGEAYLNSSEISCSIGGANLPFLASVVGPNNAPSFTVFDLSQNPFAPNPLVSGAPMDNYTNAKRVEFDGNTGLIETAWVDASGNKHGDIAAFDFSDPSSPTYISTLATDSDELKTFGRLPFSHTLYVTTGTAYGSTIGGDGALDVINTSDPTNLQLVTQVDVPGPAILQAFAVSGNTLLALGNTDDVTPSDFQSLTYRGDLTLTTMDLSNPLSPQVVATVDTGIQADGSLRVINLAGNSGVFAVVYGSPYSDPAGPTTMAIVDASDPSHPALYPQSTYYYYDGLASTSGYLFAADGNGLNTYQVNLP